MVDAGGRDPTLGKPLHPFPGRPTSLTAAPQRTAPQPDDLKPKRAQGTTIHRHTVVTHVSDEHRLQPLPDLGNGIVHAPPQLGLHLVQLGLQPRTHRLPKHREPSVAPLLPADVREAEEVEGLGLPLSTPQSIPGRKRTELDEAGLFGVQRQAELAESLGKFCPEPLGIRPMLESS